MAVTTHKGIVSEHEHTRDEPSHPNYGRYLRLIFRYLLLIAIGIIAVLPFLLAALGSFKTAAQITAYPPIFLPIHWHFSNWAKVWNTNLGQGGTFPRWVLNTAFLSVSIAVLDTIFGAMAAYAFARMKFPGRNLLFNFMLGTMMIPSAITLIPAFVLMGKIHLLNTFWSLIIPLSINASSIFILSQFFQAVPLEIEEAAIIDGASQFQIFKDVLLPLSRPALLTVFILQFQAMWNSFLQPLLYLTSPNKWVLNVALSIFQQQYKAQWNLILVGAMFNAIPVLVLFFIFSRYYIEGISFSGLKG